MDQSQRYRINAPHVVHEIFEDREAAIINLKSGSYYSLDPIGAYAWTRIESGATLGEIVGDMLQRYDATVPVMIDEMSRFVDALCAEQLIVLASEGTGDSRRPVGAPDDDGGSAKIPFQPPVLERYNDMQELLLLDPIHEVSDTGWPQRKREP